MTIVRIVDRMEADGLLERRPDPADRRARCLYLTSKGRSLLDQIRRVSDLTRAEAFAGVGRAEREQFMNVLERVHGNMCALEGKPVQDLTVESVEQSDRKAGVTSGRVRKLR
jgi:DNA-binding PadR family transcriptional regulator